MSMDGGIHKDPQGNVLSEAEWTEKVNSSEDEDYHCDLFTCKCGFQCDDLEVMDAHENHGE